MSSCDCRFMILWSISINLAHFYDMSPRLSFNLVYRIQWISSFWLKLICARWINILHIDLIIRNICNSILFELIWWCLFYITEVHVISSLDSLVLSISVSHSSLDILCIQFIMVKSLFWWCFCNLWGKHLWKRVMNESVSSFWDFFCQFSIEYIQLILFRFVICSIILILMRVLSHIALTVVVFATIICRSCSRIIFS